MKLREENMSNIRRRFTAKTGVSLPESRPRRLPARSLLLAAVLAVLLTATAFAGTLLSGLEGDDLALSAEYLGGGVVEITVENRSGKSLNLQPAVKLLRWRTGEELSPAGDVAMEAPALAPGERGVMTVNLSGAYDIQKLEAPLEDDYYYFVVTNNHFAFGQDWMCSVSFSAPEEPVPEPLPPIPVSDAVGSLPTEPEGPVVSPVDPEWLGLEGPDDPADQRWTYQWGVFTAGRELIAEADSHALVLFANVPSGRYPGSMAAIPVRYVLTYERAAVESPGGSVFVHGQTVPLSALEDCRVYEDEEYVCYEVSRYIFTDLEQYVRSWADSDPNVSFCQEAMERVQTVYDGFGEEISIVRRETPLTATAYIPRAQ